MCPESCFEDGYVNRIAEGSLEDARVACPAECQFCNGHYTMPSDRMDDFGAPNTSANFVVAEAFAQAFRGKNLATHQHLNFPIGDDAGDATLSDPS